MTTEHKKSPRPIWIYVIIALQALILLALFVSFTSGVHRIYRNGMFGPGMHRRAPHHETITASQIQGWMTFRYINSVFKLPPDYLQTKLGITDSNYINTTASKYASAHNLIDADFVQAVRDAVASYGSQNQ